MATAWGVWSDDEGGFYTDWWCWSWLEAARERAFLLGGVEQGDRATVRRDLTVRLVCPLHDDEPAHACLDCLDDLDDLDWLSSAEREV